jgi:putative transposase
MAIVSQLFFTEKDLFLRWDQVKDDFWSDLKAQTMNAVKSLIERFAEIEVQDLIGARRWKHLKRRSTYRNGFYYRTLQTSLGFIPNLKLPRIRDGRRQPRLWQRYLRRSPDVDQAVLKTFLAGVSTRRVEEALAPLLGEKALSATTVSEITKALDVEVQRFHSQPISDDFAYLIFDGIYLRMKSPLQSKRRCILVAYGIKANGQRQLLAFRLANHGESQIAWETFLQSLWRRGLTGSQLQLVIIDGNKGLANAAELVFPQARLQRCWAHKLRNAVNHIAKVDQSAFSSQARLVYNAESRSAALDAFRQLKRDWISREPEAIACLETDLESLLEFFRCPAHLWRRLRTTNAIERVFREVRRRTRPMSTFNNVASLERIIFAIFYRQNQRWLKANKKKA